MGGKLQEKNSYTLVALLRADHQKRLHLLVLGQVGDEGTPLVLFAPRPTIDRRTTLNAESPKKRQAGREKTRTLEHSIISGGLFSLDQAGN